MMRVTRKVVNRRVSRMKTEYSEDDLPLDPDFANQLLDWRRQCPSSEENWVFSNPVTGHPYYASEIQKDYLKPAGRIVGLHANGVPVALGWHSFRHTYRSLLDATGAPIGVQQKLIRHAQVATAMDVYGNALMESKREANSKVVRLLLRPQGNSQSLVQYCGIFQPLPCLVTVGLRTCKWLRGVDLNHRPLGYEPNELPDCSTPRTHHNNRQTKRSNLTAATLS